MYPPSHVPHPAPARPMSVGRILAIAAGVVLGLLVLAAAVAGGGSSADGGAGYGESGYGEQSGGSEPNTQFYDGGSLTSDGNGGIIVSGNDGTSFSTS